MDVKLFLGKKKTKQVDKMLGKKKYNRNVKKLRKIRVFDLFLQISAPQASEWLVNFSWGKKNNNLFFFSSKKWKKKQNFRKSTE